MRPPHDLMERLAAADPMPEAERLSTEQQRDADALLEGLLATPVEHDRRRARRSAGRRSPLRQRAPWWRCSSR